MNHVYITGPQLLKQLGTKPDKSLNHHSAAKLGNINVLTPNEITLAAINPKNLIYLKEKHNISKITVLDRASISKRKIKAGDQINRTGISFLRGKTPYKNLPTFSDNRKALMSTSSRVQISIGTNRFEEIDREEEIYYFEWMAPIATAWHYIGVKVQGVGVGPEVKNLEEIISG